MKKKYLGIVEDKCTNCLFHERNRGGELYCDHEEGQEQIVPLPYSIPSWCPLEDAEKIAEKIDYDKVITIGEVRKLLSDMYENLPDDDEELFKVVKTQIKEIETSEELMGKVCVCPKCKFIYIVDEPIECGNEECSREGKKGIMCEVIYRKPNQPKKKG